LGVREGDREGKRGDGGKKLHNELLVDCGDLGSTLKAACPSKTSVTAYKTAVIKEKRGCACRMNG
jgi:hypothetical protein